MILDKLDIGKKIIYNRHPDANIIDFTPDYSNMCGEGKFGKVYNCKQDPQYVIKSIPYIRRGEYPETDKNIMDFLDKDKNLPLILGSYMEHTYLHIVMEKIDGTDVTDFLQEGLLTLDKGLLLTKKIIFEVLTALSHLHRHGIIHGDVKAENVRIRIVATKFQTVLIDLGLAVKSKEKKRVVGTALYAAPEMVHFFYDNSLTGESRLCEYDEKTDIWSFGLLLHRLALGINTYLFDANSYIELIDMHQEFRKNQKDSSSTFLKEWELEEKFNYDLELDLILTHSIQYYPEKRFSADELLNFLRNTDDYQCLLYEDLQKK